MGPDDLFFLSMGLSTSLISIFILKTPDYFDCHCLPGSDEYTDLNDIYLSLEVILSKQDAKFENTSLIGTVNNLGHSLFQRIYLSIGHRPIYLFLTEYWVWVGNPMVTQ